MRGQRDFLLSLMLAEIIATPVFAQNVPIVVGPDNSSTQATASIPDLSGF